MGKFKYSKEEAEINKVLKMNQDISTELLKNECLADSRRNADNNIESSKELLRSLGKGYDVNKLSTELMSSISNRRLEHVPVLESWDDIMAAANLHEPQIVELEDIMSDSEIQAAFTELDEIEAAFSRKTSIVNKVDIAFLTVATALQVAKSLVFPFVAEGLGYGKRFTPDNRLDHNDKSIEKAHREANDKFRDNKLKRNPTGHWINILYQTVPYDITKGSSDVGINMGGRYHRLYTLGHDPILGWIFGTANILTDCITFNNFHTNRITRKDPITGSAKMKITQEVVPLPLMFQECYEEIKGDRLNLPAALFAQAQHLKSDSFTKLGLPVPILEIIDENFASKLYSEHYDSICLVRDLKVIGTSFIISKLFDMVIALSHGFFRQAGEDKDLYEVRTRKILLLSNSIASTSSIINASITQNPKNLDIGSLLNTLTHLFTDIRFITRIKQEFIDGEISKKWEQELSVIDSLYKTI